MPAAPKSSVASVVCLGRGSASPCQPSKLTGSARGAVNARAVTVAGSKRTPSSPRIIETAW